MKRMITGATLAAITCCLATPALAGDEGPTLTVGDKAPSIDIEHWIKGVEMDRRGAFEPVTDFEEGHVYVLEFWATWCGPCVASMPHLSGLQEEYKDYDVHVIGVSDETLPKVISFLFQTYKADGKTQNERTNYTLTTDPDESVKNAFFKAAGRTGIPSAFIIGKDGRVEWIGHPMNMDDALDAVVRDTWDRDAFGAEYERIEAANREMSAARRARDFDGMVKILDRNLEADPDNLDYLMQKFMLLLTELDRPGAAYEIGAAVVEAGRDNAMALNAVAWTIADDARVSKRDLDLALKAARRANDLTEKKDPAILDTLARVYYEKGDLDEAIKWQRKAAEHSGDDAMGEGIRKALEKYESEK